MIDLQGTWTIASADGRHRAPMAVPGDVHSTLIAAGIIPHPYVGRNEHDVRWVAETEWTVSSVLTLDHPPGGEWHLDITGLDTVAVVSINGTTALEAANCFRRYRPDVTKALKQSRNEISIHFRSNIKEAAQRQKAQPFDIPYAKQNCPIPDDKMGEVKIVGVNGGLKPVSVEVELSVVGCDGTAKSLPPLAGEVPPDRAVELSRIEAAMLADKLLFHEFTASDGGMGRDHFSILPYKSLKLEPPAIAMTPHVIGDLIVIDLKAAKPALFVTAETSVDGRFSDNVLGLLPGAQRRITFTPANPLDLEETRHSLTIRDLYSSSATKRD